MSISNQYRAKRAGNRIDPPPGAAGHASVVALVWENYGPMHVDRGEALAAEFGSDAEIIGIELCGRSEAYDWTPEQGSAFRKITLFPTGQISRLGNFALARTLVAALYRAGARHVFLCHYEKPGILLTAIMLRLLGRSVYLMGCSKFDDYQRSLWREVGKSLFVLPYQAAISSGLRARDYARFLGMRPDRVVGEYNTLSLARIRALAATPPAPDGVPFAERHFSIVARLVPKKNIATAIAAYAIYHAATDQPRALCIYGSGPLEEELAGQVARLRLEASVRFLGFQETEIVATALGRTLALILPSVEEQFGNVVIEASALGVPTILSDNCGARDCLVRSGVNGFVIEPDNPAGLAFFMGLLDTDQALWERFCLAARDSAHYNDAPRFAEAVRQIVRNAV